MRIAHNDPSLIQGFHAAKTEAERAFGDGEVYIEKYIENPRHIEVQILADSYGNVLHLGERDCSLQRRHQKLIEESPSPALSASLRKKMGEAAVKAAKAAKYVSAGTIEFLLGPNDQFYFMESSRSKSGSPREKNSLLRRRMWSSAVMRLNAASMRKIPTTISRRAPDASSSTIRRAAPESVWIPTPTTATAFRRITTA